MTAEELGETVQFSIGLETVISTEVEYDREGEMIGHGPITLGQMVASLVAEKVSQRITSEARREYVSPIRDRVNEIADRLVEEKFRQVIEREIVPTDTYGQPKGQPTTLGELIGLRAEKWLHEKKSNDYGGRGSKTNLQTLIDDAVGRSFKGEIQKAVDAAKGAAVAEVSKQAADVFAEIIKRAAR